MPWGEFHCWDPEDGDEDEASVSLTAYSAERAAEQFFQRGWEGEDSARVVHVRDGAGVLTRWRVLAVPTVDFRAESLPAEAE